MANVGLFAVGAARRQLFTARFANVSLGEARPADAPVAVSSDDQADAVWNWTQRVRAVAGANDGILTLVIGDVVMLPIVQLEAPGWESFSRSDDFLFFLVRDVSDGTAIVAYLGTMVDAPIDGANPLSVVGAVGTVFGFTHPVFVMRANQLLLGALAHVVAAAAAARAQGPIAGPGAGPAALAADGGGAALAQIIADGLKGGLEPFTGQLAQNVLKQNAEREQSGGAAKVADVARLRSNAGTQDDTKLFFSFMVAPPGGGANADADAAALAGDGDPVGLPSPRALNWSLFSTASSVDLNSKSGLLDNSRFDLSDETAKSLLGMLDYGPEGKASVVKFERGIPPVKNSTIPLLLDALENAAGIFKRRGMASFAEGLMALRASLKDLLLGSVKANDYKFVLKLLNYYVGRPFGDARELFITGKDYGAVSLASRFVQVMTVDTASQQFTLALHDIVTAAPAAGRVPVGDVVLGKRVQPKQAGKDPPKKPLLSPSAEKTALAAGETVVNADRDYRFDFNTKLAALGVPRSYALCRVWAGGKPPCSNCDDKVCALGGKLHKLPATVAEGDRAKVRTLCASFNPPPSNKDYRGAT